MTSEISRSIIVFHSVIQIHRKICKDADAARIDTSGPRSFITGKANLTFDFETGSFYWGMNLSRDFFQANSKRQIATSSIDCRSLVRIQRRSHLISITLSNLPFPLFNSLFSEIDPFASPHSSNSSTSRSCLRHGLPLIIIGTASPFLCICMPW